ncbi:MAG: ComEA family DNA-binding protein, partial [Gemmatimonadales bacterium]
MLLLLLGLAVAGQGVRYLAGRPGQAPGGVQLLTALAPGSPTAQRDSAMQQGRPLAPGEQIDMDVAPASEVARLPRVGPRLAKTIVADRDAQGTFGSLDRLDQVPGIGPGLLKVIAPHVRFSGSCRGGACLARGGGAPPAPTDINSATAAELDALPGIGLAKARAVIRFREEHGPF